MWGVLEVKKIWRDLLPLVRTSLVVLGLATFVLILLRITSTIWYPDSALKSPVFSYSNFDSFLASWIVNVLFLGFIGISMYVTQNNPRNHPFERRISYVLNAYDLEGDKTLHDYKVKELRKTAAFVESCKISIAVTHYDNLKDCYKIETHQKRVIRNLINDIEYVDDSLKVTVQPDKIDGFEMLGAVFNLRTIDGNVINNMIEHTIEIDQQKESFEESYRLVIGPGKAVEYELDYWIWQAGNRNFWITCDRYMKSAVVAIKSLVIDKKITVSMIDDFDRIVNTKELIYDPNSKSSEVEIFSGNMEPQQKVRMLFKCADR